MKELNNLLNEVGISKVRLAKYLGVSRQMLYNYLGFDNISQWPKEKVVRLYNLLDIKDDKEIKNIKVDSNYITSIEDRMIEGLKNNSRGEVITDLKGFNRKEQEVLADVINLLKEKLSNDNTKNTYYTYIYLYHYLQAMETSDELKYMLAYMSKAMGFSDPMDFVFSQDKQFIFESIMFRAFTLYKNKEETSKTKIADTHKQFVESIEQKKEEKLSRTQELNSAKIQALKELGYTEINEKNAKEVLEKIAEIESRKV